MLISKRVAGLLEWRDDSGRVFERLNAEQLRALGWYVMFSSDGGLATITKPGKTYIATQWPTEDDKGAVPERLPDSTVRRLSNGAAPMPDSADPEALRPTEGGGSRDYVHPRRYQQDRYAYSK